MTLEFVGPLGVAFAASRHRLDVLWALLAATGIVLLSPAPGGDIDGLGAALALLAGAFWAAYIVLTERIGRSFDGGDGLAIAMVVAAALLIPARRSPTAVPTCSHPACWRPVSRSRC